MGKKESNPRPSGIEKPPAPPAPPPSRIFKQTFWSGLAETRESKQATRDWQNYIRGYSEGLNAGRNT